MTIADSIRQKLQTAFPGSTYLELENESHTHSVAPGSETHFRLVLVSEQFEGVDRISRQRRVMELFDEERAKGLHALTMRLMSPGEWDLVKDNFQMQSPACHGGSKGR